ncbi:MULTISPECIES: lipopolysaccharide biosynthesis protein [Paracoccus]|nr:MULTISPECIES: lipopolysaccharide biosynthesis protein [Paracoccus]|tara:strand:- start:1393 stop:2814 length:1422 start_codon:yes stop_codon:yes gene_type:complete
MATGGAQAIKLGLQIISVIVLSRLLAPDDFGLVAMAGPVLAFMGLFQNLGLTQATVQRPRIGHEEVNFLFWINVGVSVAVAAAVVAIAPLAADFYNEPRVGPLIAAMALPVLLSGSGAQHGALLNRRMEFGRLAMIEVAVGLTTLGTAIVWASISPSYWALWGASVAGALVGIILVWVSSPWRPSRPGRAGNGWSMVGFGAELTGFNFANFFARNLDNILIGRYWGGVQLGLYERAYKLLLFPLTQITNPLSRVMVPTLSRMSGEPDRYRRAYLRVIRLVLLATLPGVAMSIAMADVLIPFLLGEQWAKSAIIFAALGFAGLVQPLNNPAGWLFVSQGRSREFLYWGLATAGFAVTAFSIGIGWGAVGVAFAYAISEYIKTPILWWYVGRRGPIRVADILKATWPFLLGSHLVVLALWVLIPYFPETPLPALVLGMLFAYAAVTALASMTASGRETLKEVGELLFGIARRIRN